MMGGKAVCVPGFQWLHRFNRPNGIQYPLMLEDRIWNYFIGWLEITQDENHFMVQDTYNYFKDKIPQKSLDHIFNMAKQKVLI